MFNIFNIFSIYIQYIQYIFNIFNPHNSGKYYHLIFTDGKIKLKEIKWLI